MQNHSYCKALFFFVLFCIANIVNAAGDCSPYAGQASLNEFFKDRANQANDGDDFLEVKILNPAITDSIFLNWSVLVCEELAGGTQNDTDGCTPAPIPLSDFTNPNEPWKVLEDGNIGKYINFKTGFEAILLDHNNDVIDYVSVSIDGTPQLEEANCQGSDLPFPYLAGAPGASDKYVFRTPDGTGPWDSASSGAADGTEEDTNDVPSGGGSYPVLSVSDITVTKGQTATFTLTLDKSIDDPVVIFYETKGGTAIPSTSSPSDYTYANSSITFPANTTTLTLDIDITTEGVSPASSGTVFFYLHLFLNNNPPTSYANAVIQNAYPKATILGTVSQTIVLSTGSDETLDGLSFTNGSLAQYDPLSSPATLYFGETKFDDDENISAVHVLDNGNIVLSTGNQATLGGLTFRDGDLIEYNPTTDTSTLYFNQDNFTGNADISAVYVKDNGNIILSTTADAVLKGVSFRNGDLVEYNPGSDTASLFFNQDNFSDPNTSIDGVHILESGNLLLSMTIGDTLGGYSFRDGDIIEYNTTTNIASLYFDQNLFSRSGADINALTLPKTANTNIHHIEIIHDTSALTCNPEQVTIKACANADCSTLFSSSATVGLSPTGWIGGDSQTFTGSANISLKHTVAETVTLSTTSVTPIANNSLVCKTAGGTIIDPCNITFSDSGFIFRNDTDSVSPTTSNTIIPVQISGKPSNTGYNSKDFSLRAVQKSATDTTQCAPAFQNKTLDIDFAAECINPSSCITAQRFNLTSGSITGDLTATTDNNFVIGTSSSYDTRTITFDTDGKALISFTYPEAGIIELHARHNLLLADGVTPSGNYITGSSSFVVRPLAFNIDIAGQRAADYLDDGTLNDSTSTNLSYAADATGSAFTRAGVNFITTVSAVRWQAADDADNDGIADSGANLTDNTVTVNFGNESTAVTPADISVTHTTAQPDTGTFTNPANDASFTNGTANKTLNWDEVGIIDLTASYNNYLGVGNNISTTITSFGRFTPDHFDTLVTHGCNIFSYSAQPFIVTVSARNAAGNITDNYRDTFAFGVALSDANPASPALGVFANNTIGTASFSSNSADNGASFGVGSTQVANNFSYTFNDKETLPETIELRATDNTDTTISSNGFTEGSTEIRSGRTKVENAYGSELVDMAVPAFVESYTSNGFAINTDDTCSVVTATLADIGTDPITIGDGSGATQTCIWDDDAESGADNCSDPGLLPGLASLQFASPAIAGNFNLYLKSPGENNTGDISITLTSPIWLQYDWDGDSNHDNDPSGVASFGLYRGDDRIIYQREVF